MIKCKICGKKLKMLGWHLRSIHHITNDNYSKLYPDADMYDKEYGKKLSNIHIKRWEPLKKIKIKKERITKKERVYCKNCNKEFIAFICAKRKFCCHKCTTDYNKGPNHVLYGRTKKDHLGLMKASLLRKKRFQKGEINMSGQNNPMYGKKRPDLVKYNRENKSKENKEKIKRGIHSFQQPQTIENIRKSYKNMERSQKLSKVMLNGGAIKALKGNKSISYIEKELERSLIEFNIGYIPQFVIKNKIYDFYIPSRNLLIECDGRWWHNYPLGTFNDKLKDEIAEDNGYNIIRFWGNDIRSKMNECINKIISYH